MAKIKPIALTTHDLEQAASFYKDVFGMTEVGRMGDAICDWLGWQWPR